MPPPFAHHVDDNMYADVAEHLMRTISASVISLYEVLGYPSEVAPSTLQFKKFNTEFTHKRKAIGRIVDTRKLEVTLVPEKRDQVINLLAEWLTKHDFTLQEISSLHGSLGSLTIDIRWARPLFFGLQNAIRRHLTTQFHVMQRWYKTSERASSIAQQLPESLMQRLEPLIARDKAQLLWMSRRRFQVTTEIRKTIETVFQVLQNKTYHWAAPIAHLIPRDHHFVSVGDASNVGGGAYCEQLQFWFDI
jgi:hypothetical protein